MATPKKEPVRYAVVTGLQQVEEGDGGRSRMVIACVEEGDGIMMPTIEGAFFLDSSDLSGKRSIRWGSCGEEHELHGLLDAFERTLVPMDPDSGQVLVPVDVDDLVKNAVRWLRNPGPAARLRAQRLRLAANGEARS